jgi:hypothetical protein
VQLLTSGQQAFLSIQFGQLCLGLAASLEIANISKACRSAIAPRIQMGT